jgi:hypothetical protein
MFWSRRLDIAGAALSCVGLLLVFSPVLIGGKTLSTASYTLGTNGLDPFPGQDPVGEHDPYRLDVSASGLAFEPWAEVTSSELWDSEIPLWNPYQGAGAPHAGNMQSAVFDPLNIAVNLHPTPLTWDLTLIGTFIGGAIFTYAFCRVIGMGYLAAVAGATAYSLSGYFSLYSNNGFVRTFLYLPLICLLIEWVMRSKRFVPIPILGLAVFGSIAVGMPEIVFFVLLLTSAFAIYRIVFGPRVRSRWKSLAALAGAFAFGLALSAPLLALFVEYERLSFNLHKGESAVGMSADPARFLLNWLAPFFNGQPNDSTSPPGSFSGTRNWIGGAVFALAIVGLASRTVAARLVAPFFGVAGAILLAKAYGAPVVDWLGRLPVVERVNTPAFGLPCVGYALAIVAAAGVDGIRRGNVKRAWLFGGLALAGLGGVALARANRTTLEGIPGDQVVRQIGFAGLTLFTVVVVVLVMRNRAAAYAAVAVVAVELVVLAPNPFAERRDPYAEPSWVEALEGELADRPTERVFGVDTMLYPNTGPAHGFYDIRMLDALYVDRYFDYVQTFIVPGIHDRFVGSDIGSQEGTSAYRDNQMFDLLGVRYIVSKHDELLTDLLPPGAINELLDARSVTVGGEARPALFQHATSEIPIVLPSPVVGTITFSYGVDDQSLTDPAADGVQFSMIATRASGESYVVWDALYAPGDPLDPDEPGWRDVEVRFGPSEDPVVEIRLRTDARSNGAYDWAAWSAFQFEDSDGGEAAPEGFELIGEFDGTFVYENPNSAPRAFVVHDVQVVPDVDAAKASFEAASDRFPNGALRLKAFDITERAVVEAGTDELPQALTAGQPECEDNEAAVEIIDYEANEVTLRVETACPGLVVLTDTYFPGWQATVNGESADIHPTNMALRGVVVEPGRSEVIFRYRPANFRLGIVVASGAVLAMAAAWLTPVVMKRARDKGSLQPS